MNYEDILKEMPQFIHKPTFIESLSPDRYNTLSPTEPSTMLNFVNFIKEYDLERKPIYLINDPFQVILLTSVYKPYRSEWRKDWRVYLDKCIEAADDDIYLLAVAEYVCNADMDKIVSTNSHHFTLLSEIGSIYEEKDFRNFNSACGYEYKIPYVYVGNDEKLRQCLIYDEWMKT